MKTGVLLVNLGTPNSPERGDVYIYLKEFLLDRRVLDISWLGRNLLVRGIIAPFRSGASSKIYKKLWTPEGSPLKFYGERLASGVQKNLGEDYVVVLAMRYQNPSIEIGLKKLQAAQVSKLIILPLFTQYASASTGSVYEEVFRLLSKDWAIPELKIINSFYNNPDLINIFAENAQKYDISSYDHIIFSYHGLPERQMTKADTTAAHCLKKENCCTSMCNSNRFCYAAQCHETTRLIAEKLNLPKEKYTLSFQSRLGRAEWMKPYTTTILKNRAELGDKRLLVFSPAFVSDCLETTIEISEEYREAFEKMGGHHLDLVESLNDNPKWIQAVANMIRVN